MWTASFCIVAAALACRTPSVDAPGPPYDPTTSTDGRIYHWPLGAPISVHVVAGPAASGDTLLASTTIALARWAGTLAYREHELRMVTDPTHADVLVRDSRTESPVDLSCAASGWTHAETSTFFCPDADTTLTLPLRSGARGQVKVLITVQVEPTAPTVDENRLVALVLHEVGHALGIGGHSGVSSDAMFGSPRVTTPSLRDARTLRYLLHRRPDITL